MPAHEPSPPLPTAFAGSGTPRRLCRAGMGEPAAAVDPGTQRPEGVPLQVVQDPQTEEYLQVWLQKDPSKDPRVTSAPATRNGATTGYCYVTRRSSGASCLGEDGRHLCKRIHLCATHPCPSDHRKKDGTVDHSKWLPQTAPWHLLLLERDPQAPDWAQPGPGGPPGSATAGGGAAAAAAVAAGEPHAGGGAASAGLAGAGAGDASASGQEQPPQPARRRLPDSFSLGPRLAPPPPQPGPGPRAPATEVGAPAAGSSGLAAAPAPAAALLPAGEGAHGVEPASGTLPAPAGPDAHGVSEAGQEQPPQGIPAPSPAQPAEAAAERPTRAPEPE